MDEKPDGETREKIVVRWQIEYLEPFLRHYFSLGLLGFKYSDNGYQTYRAGQT
jgi:hypothetical protein